MWIVEQIKELRKLKTKMKAKEDEVAGIKEQYGELQREMFEWWHNQDLETRNKTYKAGQVGKVTFVTKRQFSVVDSIAFERWQQKNELPWELLHRLQFMVVNKYCRELLDETGVLPEGVESYESEEVRLTKGE